MSESEESMKPQREDIERLYVTPKIVDGRTLIWEWKNRSYRLEAPVVCPEEGVELTLRAVYRARYSFGLWYKRTIPVRRWDYSHYREGNERRVNTGHKHPDPVLRTAKSRYRVADIPIDDPNAALMAFLRECNITVEGAYQPRLF